MLAQHRTAFRIVLFTSGWASVGHATADENRAGAEVVSPCMGWILSRRCPTGALHFLIPQSFFVRPSFPFLRRDPRGPFLASALKPWADSRYRHLEPSSATRHRRPKRRVFLDRFLLAHRWAPSAGRYPRRWSHRFRNNLPNGRDVIAARPIASVPASAENESRTADFSFLQLRTYFGSECSTERRCHRTSVTSVSAQ